MFKSFIKVKIKVNKTVINFRTKSNEVLIDEKGNIACQGESSLVFGEVNGQIYTKIKLIIDHMKFSEILVKLERRNHLKFIKNAYYLNSETYKGEFENEDIEAILRTISLSTR